MIKLRYHRPGTAPGTLAGLRPNGAEPSQITLIQYDEADISEFHPSSVEELISLFDPQKVNWINVDGLGDLETIRAIADHFHIHPLAIEDVLTTHRPKAELHAEHFHIISDMFYQDEEGSVSAEQVSLFVGADYVLTFQEATGRDVFDTVRARLNTGRGFARRMKADYLAYALLDAIVDQFFPILESVGDAIEAIEDRMLEKPSRKMLRRLYDCKRLLLLMRHGAWPQREIFSTLIRDDSELFTRSTQVFLRDCYDHTTQIIDIIESFRDLSAGLTDVYLSSLGFRTNEIMRILTVVSVLFIPLTFLAGVYGMNFDTRFPLNMPELNWPFGYIAFWVASLICVVAMLVFFHRKKWL